jgi:hypothetical protein
MQLEEGGPGAIGLRRIYPQRSDELEVYKVRGSRRGSHGRCVMGIMHPYVREKEFLLACKLPEIFDAVRNGDVVMCAIKVPHQPYETLANLEYAKAADFYVEDLGNVHVPERLTGPVQQWRPETDASSPFQASLHVVGQLEVYADATINAWIFGLNPQGTYHCTCWGWTLYADDNTGASLILSFDVAKRP